MSTTGIFSRISTAQLETLEDALALIMILIAGADGEIDAKEFNWAEKLTNIRSYAKPKALNDFYGRVHAKFTRQVETLLNELPTDLAEREKVISKELSKINYILPRLENEIAYKIYKSYLSFAQHVAKASGGFLGFGSISYAEKQLIHLPMIDAVILMDEEE